MTTDDLLTRADALVAEWYGTPVAAIIRDLAAALRKERAIAEANYKSLSDALHVEQDRTHRYHERVERAEADLFQARQAAFQEGVGRAAVERERDKARALLRRVHSTMSDIPSPPYPWDEVVAALGDGK